MRRILWLVALVGLFLLPACSDTPPVSEELNIRGNESTFVAIFDLSASKIPFPSNLLFSVSDEEKIENPAKGDGTLNIPVDDETDISDPKVAMNALDGFSTVAPISTTFSSAIDPATLTPETVRVFEVTLSGIGGAVTNVNRELSFGLEFVATLSSVDPTGSTLVILPLAPLAPSSSYMVMLTDGIKGTNGLDPSLSAHYAIAKTSGSLVGTPAEALEPVRQLVNAQELFLEVEGVDTSTVVLSWTFSTQSAGVVLNRARENATGIAVLDNPLGTTEIWVPGSPGYADVISGTLTLPYYLRNAAVLDDNGLPTEPLTKFWTAAGGANLTAVDPDGLLFPYETATPINNGDETIPLLVSVPNIHTKPDTGWKTVIFQHGITSDRSSMLAAADRLAADGFAVVAIDLPLHGLPVGHPLRFGPERTFDLDFVHNDTKIPLDFLGGETPDGADPSGTHFINLASLLTSRDNARQAVADLFALTKALGTMDYLDDGLPDFDTTEVYFVGHSLGGILGSTFLALEPTVKSAVLGMPGGGIAKLLDGSAAFGPVIAGGLASNGVVKGTSDYESFLGATQTVIDSVDPINYANGTVSGRGVMMLEVLGDTVVPNNVFADAPVGTVPSLLAGTDPLATFMGLQKYSSTTLDGTWLRFISGDHSSILDPTDDLTVTIVMQNAMATFLATDGATVAVSDDTVLE